MKVARWIYQKAHQANFEQEGLYNLSSIFYQMATSTNLLNSKVYEVQETWVAKKDLRAANWAARASPKDINFFQIISPKELPKIMGLKGIHSSEALWWWGGLTFCPWCGKEGQKEGMVVNHLLTLHYHLALVYACCLDYFTTNAETICHHAHGCKPTTAGTGNDESDREEEDYEDDDYGKSGDKDDEFEFEGLIPSIVSTSVFMPGHGVLTKPFHWHY